MAARRAFTLSLLLSIVACAPEPRVVYQTKIVYAPCPSASTRGSPVGDDEDARAPRTCGEHALALAGLRAEGKGDRHPAVMAAQAELAKCGDTKPTLAECNAVRAKRDNLITGGRGPKHPDVVVLDEELELCNADSTKAVGH